MANNNRTDGLAPSSYAVSTCRRWETVQNPPEGKARVPGFVHGGRRTASVASPGGAAPQASPDGPSGPSLDPATSPNSPEEGSSAGMTWPKVVLFTGDYPWPPIHGGRREYFNKIVQLHKHGVRVALIATARSPVGSRERSVVAEFTEHQFVLMRDTGPRALFSLTGSFQTRSRLRARQPQNAVDWLAEELSDFVRGDVRFIADGFYVVPLAQAVANRFDQGVILRSHNVESDYFRELARAARLPHQRAFYLMEAVRLRREERRYIPSVQAVFDISMEDVARHRALGAKVTGWVPPFVEFSTAMPEVGSVSDLPTLLFVGALFTVNNQEGLRWMLKSVWPRLSAEDERLRLCIVGSRPPRWLTELCATSERVEVVADVDDVSSWYRRGTVFINPVWHGSGVNMKNVEAISHGIPVVTTKKGARGLGLQDGVHVLVADTPEAFAQAVLRLLADPARRRQLAENAWAYVRSAFAPERAIAKLLLR